MCACSQRFLSFAGWSRTSPEPEDLADAGFSHILAKEPDMVICPGIQGAFMGLGATEYDPKVEYYIPLQKLSEIGIKTGSNSEVCSTFNGITVKIFTSESIAKNSTAIADPSTVASLVWLPK